MSAFGVDIDARCVRVFGEGVSRDEALDQLVDAVATCGVVTDVETLRRSIHEREEKRSTGIGGGVAIPHVDREKYVSAVARPTIGVGISKAGIDFNAADSKPVHVMVLFAMPPDSVDDYLRLLSQVMMALRTPRFKDRLVACEQPQDVVAVLNESAG